MFYPVPHKGFNKVQLEGKHVKNLKNWPKYIHMNMLRYMKEVVLKHRTTESIQCDTALCDREMARFHD